MDISRQELRRQVEKIARDSIIGTRIKPHVGSLTLPMFGILDEFESAAKSDGIYVHNLGYDVIIENRTPGMDDMFKQRIYIYAVPYYDKSDDEGKPFMCRLNIIAHKHDNKEMGVTSFLMCDLRESADEVLRYRMDEHYLDMKNVDGSWKIL